MSTRDTFAEDALASVLHPVTWRTVAQFIARRRDHFWIARQCDVPVAAVFGVERALLASPDIRAAS